MSAIVYGDATGVAHGFNRWLYHRLVEPDITFILMGSAFNATRENDSYEASTSLQRLVRVGYSTWAREDSRSIQIDASASRAEVSSEIRSHLALLGVLGAI